MQGTAKLREYPESKLPRHPSKHKWDHYISVQGQNPTDRPAEHHLYIKHMRMC